MDTNALQRDALLYAAHVRQRPTGGPLWTHEECLAFDGLVDGCGNVAAYQDAITREALQPCTVCDAVFHQRDLHPCGPADAACPDCRDAWETLINPAIEKD